MGAKNSKTIAIHDADGNLTGSLPTGGKDVPTANPLSQQRDSFAVAPFAVGDQVRHPNETIMVTVRAVGKCHDRGCTEPTITFIEPMSDESYTSHANNFELVQEYKNPLRSQKEITDPDSEGFRFSKLIMVETPHCPICGKTSTLQVREAGILDYRGGKLIQVAFPDLPADIREQLISGTHPECWTKTFGSEDDN
jgi:hypothetical protein